ncbi:LysR family transcriptional regulator [Gorillibacterium timonense]|uniref:LysR family transcriptional regulator n=1 Tax=Gorillibacterium timonense TaxID=1689269 RepID=UPI00071E0EA5|nr:LysR family transcriptional regulator [Gorillibacterium timonense]
MNIHLELYRIFYLTAKTGSLSKAAKELYTSQPSVSHSIKLLEEKLGGQLFYRSARGVSLTPEGQVLYDYIEQGYGLMMTGELRFAELKQMNAGQLRISVCGAVCKYDLLDAINRYAELYPCVRLNIRDESSTEIARLLSVGESDIGVVHLHQLDERSFTLWKQLPLQDCFVVGERYRSSIGAPLSPEELAERYPLILLQKGGTTRDSIDRYFASHEVEVTPHLEVSHLDLMVELAAQGLGAACVAKKYVQRELQCGQLYELPLQALIPERHLGLVTKNGMPLSTAAQKFLDLLER